MDCNDMFGVYTLNASFVCTEISKEKYANVFFTALRSSD